MTVSYEIRRVMTTQTFWEWFADELARGDYGVAYALTFAKPSANYLVWC